MCAQSKWEFGATFSAKLSDTTEPICLCHREKNNKAPKRGMLGDVRERACRTIVTIDCTILCRWRPAHKSALFVQYERFSVLLTRWLCYVCLHGWARKGAASNCGIIFSLRKFVPVEYWQETTIEWVSEHWKSLFSLVIELLTRTLGNDYTATHAVKSKKKETKI